MQKNVMLWTGMARARRMGYGMKIVVGGKGAFITEAVFLIDGGATASYFYGPLKPEM